MSGNYLKAFTETSSKYNCIYRILIIFIVIFNISYLCFLFIIYFIKEFNAKPKQFASIYVSRTAQHNLRLATLQTRFSCMCECVYLCLTYISIYHCTHIYMHIASPLPRHVLEIHELLTNSLHITAATTMEPRPGKQTCGRRQREKQGMWVCVCVRGGGEK